MSAINCNKCGNSFSDENNFCPNCGAPVPTVTYCRNCGSMVENGNFCTSCGRTIDNYQTNYQQNYQSPMFYNQPKRTCGMAVTSMVLGILSFFCFGFITAIPAIILGFISLSKINRENLEGRGFAITGIVTGIIELVLTIIVCIIFVPIFLSVVYSDAPEEVKRNCCSKAHGVYEDEFCDKGHEEGYNLYEYFSCVYDYDNKD